jgi:hypothetical protein
MTPHREQGSTLSVHRAFVVHLSAEGEPRRTRFAGRVEHLSSGRSALFSSLRELLAFFATFLDAGGHSRGDCSGTELPPRICQTPDSFQKATPGVDAPATREP